MSETVGPPSERLQRLRQFLEQDPHNLGLLADASQTALAAGSLEAAAAFLERYATLAPLPAEQQNLAGVIALAQGRSESARDIFIALKADNASSPSADFNLAWAYVMLRQYEKALPLLEGPALATSPGAAALKVQVLHYLGRLEEALTCGKMLSERDPRDKALSGALAAVAMDAEETELARIYAYAAGDQEDGLSTLGMLALSAEQPRDALSLFDRALAINPASARGLVGKGLGLLAEGRVTDGALLIDQGAELFERHLGSWIAAGWAHFSDGDLAAARMRFERALALDGRFAEAQGSLAVIDILQGDPKAGERRADMALRLDRRCLSAAMAKSLLLEQAGEVASAERVRHIAVTTPIGKSGKTIAQVMPGLMAGFRKA